MPLPITIPNSFANATSSIPLSELDANFSTVAIAVNSIGNGAYSLANVAITGGSAANLSLSNIAITSGSAANLSLSNVTIASGSAANLALSNVTITGGSIANVSLDNVSVDIETLSNVTINNLTVNGNATFSNATITANVANITTANIVTTNIATANITTAIFSAGNVAAPSITTSGDTNTGIFFPAAGSISFSNDGIESVRVSSDGRLQINGSNTLNSTLVSTANDFPLASASTAYQFRAEATFNAANTSAVGFGSTYQLPATGAFSSSYQIYAGGLTSGGATLTNNYGVYVASQSVGDNIYGVYSTINTGANRWNFYANGTAPNYFAGNVGIGTTAPLTALNVNGTGGELIRISITSDGVTQQEPALGFATGVTNTNPAAKISALELDASDSRASLLFYTRGTNSDTAPTERLRITSSGGISFGSSGTAYGTAGQALISTGDAAPVWTDQFVSITYVFSNIGAGDQGDLTIPFNCTITEWTLLADVSGSVVIDIWEDTYANYPPTVADTITGSAKPTISASTKGQSSTLTGWSPDILAGNTLRFNVDSASTVSRVTLSLKVKRT